MAETEITKSSCGTKRIKHRCTRVDLTPMVDLGFLLITFFVFTSAMALPKTMGIIEPVGNRPNDPVCNSCVLTVVLQKDNRLSYYEGMPENNPPVNHTSFAVNGIRQVLLDKIDKVRDALGDAGRFVLIIKPGPESSMQNFVDIMDEVAINGIRHYYTSEITETDKKLFVLR
jgi:biopolymer transport protein ExbD